MMKNKTSSLIGLAVVAALAAGGYYGYRHWQAKPPAERYRTQIVARNDVVQTASATGTLNPVRVVNVGTQVSGTVKKLYVDYNSTVKEGQVLLELDTEQLQAKLAQSRAALAANRAKLALVRPQAERMRGLYKQEFASRQELDQAEADLATAEAAVQQSLGVIAADEYNMKNAIIRSPISGVVIDKVVDEGQTVAASFQTPTLIKIAQDLTKMQIDARFAEADLGNIKEGLQAGFRVDAFPSRNYSGTVRQVRLNPTTDQNVVTYDVVVDVDNDRQKLLPGMTAYVDIELGRREHALTVPNGALRFRPADLVTAKDSTTAGAREHKSGGAKAGANGNGQNGAHSRPGKVYVLQGEQLRAIPLRVGLTDGRVTEVVEGALKEGDRVVVGDNQAESKSGGLAQPPGGPMMRRF
ncbi:efflux RND transporter periplasmic adaptor subunit [Chitinivorax sp. PXF-14]|uniref:efflux RND transporter periplasmic adaptor subunit n=1 Tax=Chitinivorax sp. PXF-14 TaxID=3230488 RepID=UPI003466693B